MGNSLSLCVICKNEEKNIGNLLKSVQGDLFDEIVIVDTGSEDRTLEVIKRHSNPSAKVFFFDWIDNFGAARNNSFSKATSDYIMWCLTPYNKILTKKGYKPIKDVTVGEEVLTHKGKFQKVTKIMKRCAVETLLEISTHLFNKKIKITKNHEVLAIKNYKCDFKKWCRPSCSRQIHSKSGNPNCKQGYRDYTLEWIPAGELEANDILVFPKIKDVAEPKTYQIKVSSKERNNQITEIKLNADLMRLFGYFLAEGSFNYGKIKKDDSYPRGFNFAFHINELEYQKDVINLIKENFGIDCEIYPRKENNVCVIQCNSVSIARLFKELLGELSKDKDFPTEWLLLEESYITNLFLGWYLGDGDYAQHSDSRRGRSISEPLLEKFRILLNRLNIVPYISKDGYGYNLRIGGKQLESFNKFFGIKHRLQNTRKTTFQKYFYQDEDYVYYPIKSIEKFDYTGDVFNLEVAQDNSYIVEGMTVHNCDSDDIIKPEDYEKLRDLKKKLHEAPMWLMKYEYAHDEHGNSICSFFRERIIKRSLNLKWEEPIHEYLPIVAGYRTVDIEVHHNQSHSTSDRNIPLLEGLVKENPDRARNVFYLGKELFDAGRQEEAVALLEQFIHMPDAWSENKYNAFQRLSSYYKQNKELEKAKDFLLESVRDEPLKADGYCNLGELCLEQGNKDEAIHWYKIASNMVRPEGALDIIEPKYHTWLPHLQLCVIYNAIGKVEEATYHNEIALNYLPQDQRMRHNREILKDNLKEKFLKYDLNPHLGKKEEFALMSEVDNLKLSSIDTLEGTIGWYCTPDENAGTIRIRMLNINRALQAQGYRSELFDWEKFDTYSFVIIKSFVQSDIRFIKALQDKGIKVICDMSEDITFSPVVQDILRTCDASVCCSYELSKKVSRYNSEVITIEDAVEFGL